MTQLEAIPREYPDPRDINQYDHPSIIEYADSDARDVETVADADFRDTGYVYITFWDGQRQYVNADLIDRVTRLDVDTEKIVDRDMPRKYVADMGMIMEDLPPETREVIADD